MSPPCSAGTRYGWLTTNAEIEIILMDGARRGRPTDRIGYHSHRRPNAVLGSSCQTFDSNQDRWFRPRYSWATDGYHRDPVRRTRLRA